MKVYLIEKTAEKPVITTDIEIAIGTVRGYLLDEEQPEWYCEPCRIEERLLEAEEDGERVYFWTYSHEGRWTEALTAQVVEVIEGR